MKTYTCAEAAALLRLSGSRVRQLCKSGALNATRHGKWAWVIDEPDLVQFKIERIKDMRRAIREALLK